MSKGSKRRLGHKEEIHESNLGVYAEPKSQSLSPEPRPQGLYPTWAWAMVWIVLLIFLGLMIWMAVEIGLIAPYLNGWPSAGCKGNFVVVQGVAAEPYSGPPTLVSTGVSDVSTCQLTCDSDANCLFFTHDLTNSKCYFYNNSILPLQNTQAAVVGPTKLNANVFVKNTGRYVQARVIL